MAIKQINQYSCDKKECNITANSVLLPPGWYEINSATLVDFTTKRFQFCSATHVIEWLGGTDGSREPSSSL